MSDLSTVKNKVREGKEWRGTITVSLDEEETAELTVRQLVDPEFEEVMDLIDKDELRSLREDLPEDLMDEYHELQDMEELDEEQEERLVEIQGIIEEETPDLFDALSSSTFEGIRLAAKYAVEPDEEDLREAFVERAAEIEEEYGVKVQTPDDVRPALQDEWEETVDSSVNFIAFTIGMEALIATAEDEGN